MFSYDLRQLFPSKRRCMVSEEPAVRCPKGRARLMSRCRSMQSCPALINMKCYARGFVLSAWICIHCAWGTHGKRIVGCGKGAGVGGYADTGVRRLKSLNVDARNPLCLTLYRMVYSLLCMLSKQNVHMEKTLFLR